MSLDERRQIGAAPTSHERDPDLPLVIIDLSGRARQLRPAPLTSPPMTGAVAGQPPPPPSSPPRADANPADPDEPQEPATEALDLRTTDLGTTDLGTTDLGTTDLGTVDLSTADLGTVDLSTVVLTAPGPATRNPAAYEPPTTELVLAEPATVNLDLHPAVDDSPKATIRLAGASAGPSAAPTAAKAHGRARVVPWIRRRPRPAAVVGHRRPWRRSSLRVWEATAWIAALGVVATMVGFVIRSVPASAPLADAPTATAAAAPGAARPSAVAVPHCVVVGCMPSYPPGPPTRVLIPRIKVDSSLQALTLDGLGHLNAPTSYDQAGWYAKGVTPGDVGPAVIAGHVDSVNATGVFFALDTLKIGDLIRVKRGGVWVNFRVTLVERYPKDQFPTEKVYGHTTDAELRVITCGGDFDTVHKRYYDNIVVYAVLAS